MAEIVYDLRQPSLFTTTFPAKSGSSFFLPLGKSSLCNCKRESNQNSEQTQPNPSYYLKGGKVSIATAPIAFWTFSLPSPSWPFNTFQCFLSTLI